MDMTTTEMRPSDGVKEDEEKINLIDPRLHPDTANGRCYGFIGAKRNKDGVLEIPITPDSWSEKFIKELKPC
jgi:hypothetical protein